MFRRRRELRSCRLHIAGYTFTHAAACESGVRRLHHYALCAGSLVLGAVGLTLADSFRQTRVSAYRMCAETIHRCT